MPRLAPLAALPLLLAACAPAEPEVAVLAQGAWQGGPASQSFVTTEGATALRLACIPDGVVGPSSGDLVGATAETGAYGAERRLEVFRAGAILPGSLVQMGLSTDTGAALSLRATGTTGVVGAEGAEPTPTRLSDGIAGATQLIVTIAEPQVPAIAVPLSPSARALVAGC